MKICILSKFPPIEGGIAAKSYWLARGYADVGASVHVVSNGNTVEDSYRIDGCYPHLRDIERVTLHEVEEELPWHIPDEPHSLGKLLDTALVAHEEHPFDVIDTGYLVPYGIAGYLLNRITGVPYVIRHGGSDIVKFLKAGKLGQLLNEVLAGAATIVTDNMQREVFSGFKDKLEIQVPYVPNSQAFNTSQRHKRSAPKFLYLGKVNWYWERKGLERIIKCCGHFPEGWKIDITCQGKGEERFREFLRENSCENVCISPFVQPWQVPAVLKEADFVFCLTVDEPIPSFSNVLVEAVSCGTTVVVNEEFESSPYEALINNIEDTLLRVTLDNPHAMAGAIKERWKTLEKRSVEDFSLSFTFDEYIADNLQLLDKASTTISSSI